MRSPALIAIIKNDEAALRKLLEEGLDPDSSGNLPPARSKPLIWYSFCQTNMLMLLLEYGADTNAEQVTVFGRHSPLGYLNVNLMKTLEQQGKSSNPEKYLKDERCLVNAIKILSDRK